VSGRDVKPARGQARNIFPSPLSQQPMQHRPAASQRPPEPAGLAIVAVRQTGNFRTAMNRVAVCSRQRKGMKQS